MITAQKNIIFQKEWTGEGERGLRDFMLIPAIFFGAVSPGLFLSSLIFDYMPGLWISLVLNFAGYGMTHMLFLGRMERFWRIVINLRSSWISRGFLFNALFSVFGLLYAVSASSLVPLLNEPAVSQILKYCSAVSAVLFAAYPGFMLSIVKAIPFWRSTLEPVLFFLQGLVGGIALQVLSGYFIPFAPAENTVLLKINFVLVLVVLLLIFTALIIKARHGATEKASVEYLLKGEFSPVFIYGAVVAGLVVPLFLLLAGILVPLDFSQYRFLYYLAMSVELAGIYFAKYGILKAGAYKPLR